MKGKNIKTITNIIVRNCFCAIILACAGVVTAQQPSTVPLYRYYSCRAGDHFYTTVPSEPGIIINEYGFEFAQCNVYPHLQANTIPLYRYYSAQASDHFYTTNPNEPGIIAAGYVLEFIQCYVFPSNGSVPPGASCFMCCSATVPNDAASGTQVPFQATAVIAGNCNAALVYDWDFGDGSPHSSEQNPTHIYSATGTFTWTLTVTASGIPSCSKSGSIVISGAPEIQITLDPSPPQPNPYVIAAAPAMPSMGAKAKVVGISPDPTAKTKFYWQISLRLDIGLPVFYDDDIQQNNLVTTGEQTIPITFKDPTAFRGGTLKFTATAVVDGKSLTGVLDNVEIQGENPLRNDIQTSITNSVPPTGLSGLAVTDIVDALKRIACQESRQRQFDALADGGVGPVLISPDLGVGVFQITTTDRCLFPFIDCVNVVFNWQANTKEGWNAFKTKIGYAKAYPKALASSPEYADYIKTVINPQRVAAKLSPITTPPAPAFTTTGPIGSNPPNQLLEDAVRGYNGYSTQLILPPDQPVYDSNDNPVLLHEFIPDADYLIALPNSKLKGLDKDPKVWTRVSPDQRPRNGDPNYVKNVISRSPNCAP